MSLEKLRGEPCRLCEMPDDSWFCTDDGKVGHVVGDGWVVGSRGFDGQEIVYPLPAPYETRYTWEMKDDSPDFTASGG